MQDTVSSHTSIHLKPSSNNKRTFYVLISSLNSSSSLSLSLITLSFHLYLHLSSTLHPCPLLPLILPDPPTFPSSLSVPGRSTTASCPVKPQHQSTQIVKLSWLTTYSTPPGLTCSRSSNYRQRIHQIQPVYCNLKVISNHFCQTGSICSRNCTDTDL